VIADYVAAPVTHFVALKVSLIDTPRGFRFLATRWHWTPITMIRVKAIVHIAMERFGSVKPWTSADEDTASKPFWPVVPNWSAVIRRDVVVPIRTLRCYSDVDAHAYLSVRSWGEGREAASNYGG
jgi:hypothetical protein